jgi:two-component system sensor histidine kinase ChvG
VALLSEGGSGRRKPIRETYGFGIRTQLLLPFLLLLSFPFLASFWLNNWSFMMLEYQRHQTTENARIMARSLEASELLLATVDQRSGEDIDADLIADSVHNAKVLDGRDGDWLGIRSQQLTGADLMDTNSAYKSESLSVEYKLGASSDHLYLYLKVLDDHVVYREINNLSVHRNDHLQIALIDPDGEFQRFTIAAFQPAMVAAHYVSATGRSLRQEESINTMWLATEHGYNLELKIPLTLVGEKFSFAIADVDDADLRDVQYLMGRSRVDSKAGLANLILPSLALQKFVASLEEGNVWLLDSQKRIVSFSRNSGGWSSFKRNRDESSESSESQNFEKIEFPISWESGFFQYFEFVFEFESESEAGSRELNADVALALEASFQSATFLNEALLGRSVSSADKTLSEDRNFVAAEPVYSNNKVIAVVVVQKSERALLHYLERVRDEMLVQFLLLLVLGFIVWRILVWLQTTRLRGLKTQLELAIDNRGRVHERLPRSNMADEIGDLSRSFSDMVERLQQYNHYLESMASRLAHELRTPVSIVRSSLDNIATDQLDDENKVYVKRAHDGLQRLSLILNNMSEATRLEQSLDMDDVESFDLVQVVQGCVGGYKLAFPKSQFVLSVEENTIPVTGLPDLIAQLFDKLISNAVEFSLPGTVIKIRLTIEKEVAILRVMNEGPSLPEDMRENLFDSMVSIRTEYDGDSSHLGLGLYIAKVVANFHGGDIKLSNREDSHGVVATVMIPVMRLSSKLRP